jgi:hypothetical protein
MPAITLSKTGVRYDHHEWMALVNSGEAETLLAKYGPGLTDEAWQRHHGVLKNNTRSHKKSHKNRY